MNCIFVKFVIFNRVIYLIVTFVILKKKKSRIESRLVDIYILHYES